MQNQTIKEYEKRLKNYKEYVEENKDYLFSTYGLKGIPKEYITEDMVEKDVYRSLFEYVPSKYITEEMVENILAMDGPEYIERYKYKIDKGFNEELFSLLNEFTDYIKSGDYKDKDLLSEIYLEDFTYISTNPLLMFLSADVNQYTCSNDKVLSFMCKLLKYYNIFKSNERYLREFLDTLPQEYIGSFLIPIILKLGTSELEYIPKEYIDYNLSEMLVSINGYHLSIVPYSIRRCSYEICEKAVRNNPSSLIYVPEEILDLDLCMIAMDNDDLAIKYIPNKFKSLAIKELTKKNSVFINDVF